MSKLAIDPHRQTHLIEPQRRTHPLIWCMAVVCAILTVAVIITGMVMFIGYLIYRPREPFVTVKSAHLDLFTFDRPGVLSTKLSIVLAAENDNTHTDASFSGFRCILSFDGMTLATLKAEDPLHVSTNATFLLNYVVEATHIPLDAQRMKFAQTAVNQDRIMFQLNGLARAWWKVGPITTKSWCILNCNLQFHMDGSSAAGSHCSSHSK